MSAEPAFLSATQLALMNSFQGARVKFQGNVLYCSEHRTFGENVEVCFQALSLITGCSVTELSQNTEGITVEAYRSS
jgi:hypothetical protein